MELLKDDFHPLYSGGALIIGQEQDAKVEDGNFDPGKFDEEQSYSGHITQVEVWNIELTAKEIYDIGNCVQLTVRTENQVVSWGTDSWEGIKMDPLEDFPLESFCKEYDEKYGEDERLTCDHKENGGNLLDSYNEATLNQCFVNCQAKAFCNFFWHEILCF